MSRSLRFASFVLSSSMIALFACSSDADERSAAEEAFFEAYAHAVCDDAAPCCAQVDAAHDAAACRALVAAGMRESLGHRKGTFVPEVGERLVSAVREDVAACAEFPFNSPRMGELRADFGRLYEPNGGGAPGAACEEAGDCAPSAVGRVACLVRIAWPSDVDEPVVSGKCVVLLPAAEGMTCDGSSSDEIGDCGSDNTFDELNAAFYCDSSDKRCHARAAIGESCWGSPACVRGARCVDGTCASPSALDAPCGSDFDCAEGLYCDRDAQRCATLKRGGEACSSPDECLSTRCDEGRCRVLSYLTADTCGGR